MNTNEVTMAAFHDELEKISGASWKGAKAGLKKYWRGLTGKTHKGLTTALSDTQASKAEVLGRLKARTGGLRNITDNSPLGRLLSKEVAALESKAKSLGTAADKAKKFQTKARRATGAGVGAAGLGGYALYKSR